MKRLVIIILIFIPLSIFSQKNLVEQNALKWFKSTYVDQNFNDPYSFKFIKITSVSNSVNDYYFNEKIKPLLIKMGRNEEDASVNDINFILSYIKVYKDAIANTNNKNDKDEYLKKIDIAVECKYYMNEVNIASKSDLLKNARYAIFIDCYSNNALGIKNFGRFAFFYYPITSEFYEKNKKYSYSNFFIDENSIVQLNKD